MALPLFLSLSLVLTEWLFWNWISHIDFFQENVLRYLFRNMKSGISGCIERWILEILIICTGKYFKTIEQITFPALANIMGAIIVFWQNTYGILMMYFLNNIDYGVFFPRIEASVFSYLVLSGNCLCVLNPFFNLSNSIQFTEHVNRSLSSSHFEFSKPLKWWDSRSSASSEIHLLWLSSHFHKARALCLDFYLKNYK